MHAEGKVVWRLLINQHDQLLIEERDMVSKTASFQVYDLSTGKQLIKNLMPEQTFWIGIEDFSGSIIYFHRFIKPDMPWHKDIIAYSVTEKKLVWENNDLVFGFKYENSVFAFKQTFDGAHFFELNAATGEIINDFGENNPLILEKRHLAEAAKDYSQYRFPNLYQKGIFTIADELIAKNNAQDIGQQEYINTDNALFVTMHIKNKKNTTQQVLYAVDLHSKKVYLEELLHKNEQSLQFDAFFTFRNFLIIIRDKSEVVVFTI